MKEFKDKTAFVTGGASGMGRAMCLDLGRSGARVAVTDIDLKAAREVAARIESSGGRALALRLDVSDAAAFEKALNRAERALGPISHLFNNAGICVSGEVRDLALEDWEKLINVNLRGVLYGTHYGYRMMLANKTGHIVNIASLAGLSPFPINTPYTAVKHAIVGLTSALGMEAESLGIRVSLVCPGIVKSDFYSNMKLVNADLAEYRAYLPKRALTPEKAARIILKGVARNKRLIVFPFHARALWYLNRLSPAFSRLVGVLLVKEFRSLRRDGAKPTR